MSRGIASFIAFICFGWGAILGEKVTSLVFFSIFSEIFFAYGRPKIYQNYWGRLTIGVGETEGRSGNFQQMITHGYRRGCYIFVVV
jgi:hypothetical protein